MNNETRSGNRGGSHRWHVAVGSRGCGAYSLAPSRRCRAQARSGRRRLSPSPLPCWHRGCYRGRAGLGATRNHVRFCWRSVMASLERSLDMRHASSADIPPLNWRPWRSPLEGTAVSTKKVCARGSLGPCQGGDVEVRSTATMLDVSYRQAKRLGGALAKTGHSAFRHRSAGQSSYRWTRGRCSSGRWC